MCLFSITCKKLKTIKFSRFNNIQSFPVFALAYDVISWFESTLLHCLDDYFHFILFKVLKQETMRQSFFYLKFRFFRFINDRRDELVLFIPIAIHFCRHTLSSSFLLCLFDHRSFFVEIFLVLLTFFVNFLLLVHFSLRFKQFIIFSSKFF